MSTPARVWKIYVITHTTTGRVYVGQTRREVKDRWWQHQRQDACRHFRHAIDKYGLDAFTVEHVVSALCQQHADSIEIEKIREYNSVANGFNISLGGQGFLKEICVRGHVLTGTGYCAPCRRFRQNKLREQDPEKYNKKRREWAKKNPEASRRLDRNKYERYTLEIAADRVVYYKENREKILAQKKQYRKDNPEKYKAAVRASLAKQKEELARVAQPEHKKKLVSDLLTNTLLSLSPRFVNGQ